MKKIIYITGIFLSVVKLSTAAQPVETDPYLSDNILASVQDISISKLLDFKKIAAAIEDGFDKARFHYIIAYEINQRLATLDQKFNSHEEKFQRTIHRYEDELDITPYKYSDDRPQFNYRYQSAEITDDTIEADIHRIQAELARTQFIQVYKYYRKRLDNYKSYLVTLRDLYKCKVIENKDNQVEYYSNFREMYQGIRLFHDAMDDAGKMHVQRDVLGKVQYIDWSIENEPDNYRRRQFQYDADGLLTRLTDTINEDVVFETVFGENETAEDFINYLFSPGFIPRDYR